MSRHERSSLRSEQTELAHIASLVTHYSLAQPDKSFELRDGARELLGVEPVGSMRERVYQVFGSRTVEDLIELTPKERVFELDRFDPDPVPLRFALRGFVSRPQLQKNNRQFDLRVREWPVDSRPADSARDRGGLLQPDVRARVPVRAAVSGLRSAGRLT